MMRPDIHPLVLDAIPLVGGNEPDARTWTKTARTVEAVSSGENHCDRNNPLVPAIRMVGLLAFGQSLAFLAICLLLCASAGAAPEKRGAFNPELQLSTYTVTKTRDPFSSVGVAPGAAPAPTVPLQLDGIFYNASDRSAIVNGLLLPLNKVVHLTIGNSEVRLKAVEITRERVVVEVGAQKVELFLNPQNQPPPPPK